MKVEPDKLPDLVKAMLCPGFYPHQVQAEIGLEQTHTSYVFLTGTYAYKIKKPVDFGFLNFTSLAAREHNCLDELRLNRRYAPEIYLDVLPIRQLANGGFHLGGHRGEIVEFALCMREFPQSGLFLHLFETGKLQPKHLISLGKQIAEVHLAAPTNAHIQAFGSVAAVREVAEDNYRATVPYIGRGQTKAQWSETRAFTERFFLEHGAWLSGRSAAGFVKECHGDLHLNNVFELDGQVQVFDCIEFNEAFRNIDVIYDVAFMAVDLDFRGRRDLAYTFLNTYLERTGDYRGAILLPLYQSMRAYIRAKVQSFLLDDPHLAEEDHAVARTLAEAYYRLAWSYTRPLSPRIWVCGGLSGSGKSTVAAHLSNRLGAIHLRSDAVRKHLYAHPLDKSGEPGLYTEEASQRTYRKLIDLAIALGSNGIPVVLDAKFDRRRWRETLYAEAWRAGLPVLLIYCRAPANLLSQRLQMRRGDISDATADLLPSQIDSEEPPDESGPVEVHFLDTSGPWQVTLESLIVAREPLGPDHR